MSAKVAARAANKTWLSHFEPSPKREKLAFQRVDGIPIIFIKMSPTRQNANDPINLQRIRLIDWYVRNFDPLNGFKV